MSGIAPCLLFALTLLAVTAFGQPVGPPQYSTASIVHGATFENGPVAGNTFISIFGEHLAWSTRSVAQADIRANRLPTSLGGVQVLIGPTQAHLVFVSPGQINALVSSDLTPGKYPVRVLRDSWAGPQAELALRETAAGLFLMEDKYPVVTRPDGIAITRENPARAGSIVTLWATGLGPTQPATLPGELPRAAAMLSRVEDLEIWLAGERVPQSHILYAGLAPGFAGLYQVNLLLSADTPENPEIRIGFAGSLSPAGQRIFMSRPPE
jgi:uncharacterized protein (TIGR03437 family)